MSASARTVPARPVGVRSVAPQGWLRGHPANALFVLPFLLVYAVLLVYPLVKGAVMSFNDYDLLSGDTAYIGTENFTGLFHDPIFLGTLRNTLEFVVVATPVFLVLGLALALALNRRSKLTAVLRTVFFGSSVLSVTVVTLVWRLVLMPRNGLLTDILAGVGRPAFPVLTDQAWALPAVALVTVWWGIGLPMMLILSSLQQVPGDIYEAAELDNAGWWRTLFSITLPSIRRTLILVAVIEIILQFQLFGQAMLMTGGGPNNASRPIVQFIYESGFRDLRLGYAAAASQVLFAMMLCAAMLQFWIARPRQDAS